MTAQGGDPPRAPGRRPARWALASLLGSLACTGIDVADPATVVTVLVSPPTAQVNPTEQLQLSVSLLDENGVKFLGPAIRWTSSEPDIATVSNTGLVTGRTVGTVSVEAAAGGTTGSAVVEVVTPPSIVLTPSALSFNATAGGVDPAPQSVTVTNGGGGTLEDVLVGAVAYGGGQPTGWLATGLQPSPLVLDVRVFTSGLGAGVYTASIPLASEDQAVAPVTLTVTFTVQP